MHEFSLIDLSVRIPVYSSDVINSRSDLSCLEWITSHAVLHGTVTATDVTITSGTLSAPSGSFQVSGNWLKSGGTFTPGGNTVTFTKALGPQTLNSGGSPFSNISHTGAGTLQLVSALTTAATFSNTGGNFDASTFTHTVASIATLTSGTYIASALQTFSGGLTLEGGTLLGAGVIISKNTEANGVYVAARPVKLDKTSDQIKL